MPGHNPPSVGRVRKVRAHFGVADVRRHPVVPRAIGHFRRKLVAHRVPAQFLREANLSESERNMISSDNWERLRSQIRRRSERCASLLFVAIDAFDLDAFRI